MKGLLPAFEAAINFMDRSEMEAVFGKNCYTLINNLYFSGQKNTFVVDVTFYTDEPQLLEDSYYELYEDFIRNSWRMLGLKKHNLTIVKKCELLTN